MGISLTCHTLQKGSGEVSVIGCCYYFVIVNNYLLITYQVEKKILNSLVPYVPILVATTKYVPPDSRRDLYAQKSIIYKREDL